MAQRRMFSKTITNSSRFLMMPLSTQDLYFHFGMNADDDGFCEYFGVMRMIEAKPDDLRILAAKEFIKIFDDKVLIILDWDENNYIQKDRYKPSKYLELYKSELAEISQEHKQKELPLADVSKMDTQVRLGEVRLGKDSNTSAGKPRTGKSFPNEWYLQVEKAYKEIKGVEPQGKEWDPIRREQKMMFEANRTVEQIIQAMDICNDNYPDWSMATVRMKIADVVAGKLVSKNPQKNKGIIIKQVENI